MKLKLSQVRKDLNLKISKGMTLPTIGDFCNPDYGITLDFDVYLPSKRLNLQRPLCWTLEQKQQLILSVLKGIELPSVCIIISRFHPKSGGLSNNSTYQIIDGKQRLSTLIDFYKGGFHIEVDGNQYFYNDFDNEIKRLIMFHDFTADVVNEHFFEGSTEEQYQITDQQKVDWFEQINFTGTAQDMDHLERLKNGNVYVNDLI